MDGSLKEQMDIFFQTIIATFLVCIKFDLLLGMNALITIKLKEKTPTDT